MPHLGRVVIDETGAVIRADRTFQATIRLDEARLIGRNLLDFTAPADRERCIFLVDKIAKDGIPVSTVKRLICADETHLWISNRLALCESERGAVRIDISVESASPPSDWVDPAELLRIAMRMVAARAARLARFPAALFMDHAWDILLAAYVSEAEGVLLTIADLHATVGLTETNASRWMRALHSERLIEYEEGDGTGTVTTAFRLSAAAHLKFERYLSDAHWAFLPPATTAISEA